MDGKHILIVAAVMISVVSSFPVDSLKYQTFVPTSLPTSFTELEALSWDNSQDQPQSESESQYSTAAASSSLSLILHHVDSLSPAGTKSESLFKKRIQRDVLRANMISAITKSSAAATPRTNNSPEHFSSTVISGLQWDSGEYFTRIAVGSPAKYFYMIMDTGSDIIWLQCQPCKSCYEQVDAIFNPKNSSSFSGVPCNSQLCNLLDSWKCGRRKQCIYEEEFGDGSVSVGDFSKETLTFGKTKVPKVAFGCGRYNKGLFVAAAGLLGLGRGRLSFPGQAGNKFGNKFSYCLATGWGWSASNSSSQLTFGDSPAAYRNAVYTPLVKNPKFNTFYYVGLEGFSVGGSRVDGIEASMFELNINTGKGGVMVDSGTSVTRLTNFAYVALRDAFRKAIKHLKPPSSYSILDTCYDLSGMKEAKVPTVDLHFRSGAKVSLPASNCMIPVDNNGTHCFAFAGTADSNGGLSIIGNIQQQGLGMVFDLANKRLGFAENVCS